MTQKINYTKSDLHLMNKWVKGVTSRDNELIKAAVKYKDNRFQKRDSKVLVEGWNIINEAIEMNIVDQVFVLKEDVEKVRDKCNVIIITPEIGKRMSDVETSQNAFAIIDIVETKIDYSKNILILEKVQDPGNLGTLIRSAMAFGFENIVISNDTVSPFNQKVIRAAQGLIFKANILFTNLYNFILNLDKSYELFMTDLHKEATSLFSLETDKKIALVLGNEGQGISAELLKIKHQNVLITMTDGTESINVAIAGSIIMNYFFNS